MTTKQYPTDCCCKATVQTLQATINCFKGKNGQISSVLVSFNMALRLPKHFQASSGKVMPGGSNFTLWQGSYKGFP